MIDLELERRDFKKTWMVLGGHFKYLVVGENQAYHLTNNAPNLTPSEKELTLSAVNTAWAMWLIQARAKQAEIDSLKAQLAKVESGEFVVVPKSSITQFWQDDEEPENFVSKEHDFDCLGDCIDIDGIMQINKHHQAYIKTEKLYGTWIAKNDDGMLIRDSFHVGTYEECLAIVAKNKAMIEAAQENSHE